MRFATNLLIVVAALLLLAAGPARAGEDVPPPEEDRFIGIYDATSDCIGAPTTPLCAVETWIACHVRGDFDTCRRADRKQPQNAAVSPGRGRVIYSVLDVEPPLGLAVSGAPLPVSEVTLIESNTYFADGWYFDNAMVLRSPFIVTRYRVQRWNERWPWRVTERIECQNDEKELCGRLSEWSYGR